VSANSRRPASYQEEYRVPFGETDAAGVVFYPNYYRWFDRMTHELFRASGHPLDGHLKRGEAPVLVESSCCFLTSVRYDDVIVLTASVGEVTNRSIRIAHTVSRDGEVTTQGLETRVWIQLQGDESKAVPIPDSIRRSLSPQRL